MRGRRGTIVGLLVLLALFLLPLRGLLRSQGPPMEEGFMLTFPQRVLRGELPNVDFLHLYGPGSVWVLAGFFKVFGDRSSAKPQEPLINKLLAMNAFNGTVLWEKDLSAGFMIHRNTLIATPDTFVGAGLNSPRISAGASGFKSHRSR